MQTEITLGLQAALRVGRLIDDEQMIPEMISLIKHCNFFIGNDSAPSIIAQCFKKKSFVVFGATRPDYMHKAKSLIPIYDKRRHKLCKHKTRQEEIDCCEEFCMERISVDKVFNQIKLNI